MDRKPFKLPLRKGFTPHWMCPTCSKGFLKQKKDSLSSHELSSSRDHSHDAWEPEWIKYTFSCQLVCSNDQCREVVICSGDGGVELDQFYDDDGYTREALQDFFVPKFFQPNLKLFELPSNCPDSISNPIEESFKLFFASPSAAANYVRKAIEQLLTEQKVKRYDRKGGKLTYVSLHRRIGLLPSKYEEFKQVLMAIKWLGNAGSHDNSAVTQDDVLDSYEFVEHVINEIYASKKKDIVARAKKVNKSKGPIKKAKSSW